MNDDNLRGLLIRATDAIESPGLAKGTVLLARKRRMRRVGALTAGAAAAAVVAVLIGVTYLGERAIGPADHVDIPPAGVTALDDAQTWLATHDYRLITQLRGPRIINVTVVQNGDVAQGEVQTMDAAEERQVGYYRFRSRADRIVTTTSGTVATPDWQPASSSQRSLLREVTDPRWILAPLESPGLRDYGRTGDAEMYRDSDGDSLFVIDGRPVRVVTHGPTGDWTRTFEIDARRR